ncbi:MAG: carboxypeptidase regulatory-like domain-containing protein [Acidobacteria bacterium]|nr:carboxypeptidase regulatory-like domain-containing protein [Acidobacteriota bacterium]
MKKLNFHRLAQCVAIFFGLTGAALAEPVEIVGTLRSANGVPLSGQISIFQDVPQLIATHHTVDKTGSFKISSDSRGGLVIHGSATRYASMEKVIPSGSTGVVRVDLALPPARDLQGRVIDSLGSGVPGAAVRIRYHEPDKPVRRVSFDDVEEQRTDGDGRFLLRDVGIGVPLVVDVLAPDYVPTSSRQIRLAAREGKVDEIVVSLEKQGASVVVQVLDKEDQAVGDAGVTLLADPAGLVASDRGSWLHPRAFRQRGVTSQLGNVRFRGVPTGRIIVRVKTADSVAEQRAVVSEGQELRVTLRIL